MEHYTCRCILLFPLQSLFADKNPELQSFITLGSTAIRYHHAFGGQFYWSTQIHKHGQKYNFHITLLALP